MTNALVVALGVIVAAAGPVLILVLNSRNKVRQYVYGTARVADISPRPTTDGRTARGRLKLVVRATGVNGVTVSTVDPAIPLDKWPDAGATLPVQVLKGNPRKLAIVWDKVQSHQDAQASERRTTGSTPRYSVDGDELAVVDSPTDEYERRRAQAADGGTPDDAADGSGFGTPSAGIPGGGGGLGGGTVYERPAEELPPDNRPTLTDLPPIAAPVIEPVRLSGRSDRIGQTRPAPRPTSPAGTGTGLAATAAPGTATPGTATTSGAVTTTGPGTAAATGPESAGGAGATGTAMTSAAGLGAGPAAAVTYADPGPPAVADGSAGEPTTEDTPPMVVRLPSNPVHGGARRRPSPRPRPGTHDRGPGRPAQAPPATAAEETPAAVTEEKAAAGSTPAADEAPPAVTEEATATYTIPEAGSTLSPPPDLPESDLPSSEPSSGPVSEPAGETATGPAAVTMTKPASTGAPAAASPAPGDPAVDPAVESAVEGGVELPGDRPAGTATLASGLTWWPDRETEQLPTRMPRAEHTPAAGLDADQPPTTTDETTTDETATTTGATTGTTAMTGDPARAVIPPIPLRSANEASAALAGEPDDEPDDDEPAGDVPANTGPTSVRPWGAVDAGRTTSAWSGNGHVRSLTWPVSTDGDDEPVRPDPYATEHYVDDAPEDQLEEQPPSEGAVGQFLAARQQPQSMPLDGVNGVSITLIVSDLERSRRFYRDTLGLTELDSGPTAAVLATGDARVVLRRVADMPPVDRRVVHLNLEVPDVYEAYERLREQGVDFVHRPRVVPQGEQLELCSATFRDPDGHAIALTKWELRR
ncbi:VOC family protein [Dactylosporangium aurantiacum]|uniref:VOC family protein n=1 Tax=Dactylosporangium aurantiacum TaxID=35754 RepID=A0A9Q9IIJ4_9ACTN|nr:VOC family protein [Dactylosporangium aurantiacum]MDG6108130.1 VOC family protein [Dactylosporangium aurantiacum]UWZ53758.1 VOC family protein [Dactylosporangium aurantiacum]